MMTYESGERCKDDKDAKNCQGNDEEPAPSAPIIGIIGRVKGSQDHREISYYFHDLAPDADF
jgi:hypothetical protein